MTGLEMLTQTKLGLTSSLTAGVATITAVVADASATIQGQTVAHQAIAVGWVAAIGAIGAVVAPIAYQAIKTWGETKQKEIDANVVNLRNEVERLASRAASAEEKAETADDRADKLAIEIATYKERISNIEGRTGSVERKTATIERKTASIESKSHKATEAIEAIKGVIVNDVLSGSALSPVAAVITDAYGRILSASGQIEFILHWKPEELPGKSIRDLIPVDLHPNYQTHESRSYNPATPFPDKVFCGVTAFTKSGHTVKIDLMLTRWFERGMKGKVEGVRFGKIIKRHSDGTHDCLEPFPTAESLIPGFNRDEIKQNTEATIKNTEAVMKANENQKGIAGGTGNAG